MGRKGDTYDDIIRRLITLYARDVRREAVGNEVLDRKPTITVRAR